MSEDLYSESSSRESDAVDPPDPPQSSPWFIGEDQQTVISGKNSLSSTQPRMQKFRPAELGEALQGMRLEHFVLEQYVGGGGMGAVFRGRDESLGRVVAIKVVSSRNTDSETLRRFRNEAQSAARLDHPNIARVYYVGEDKGWNFIVFEFIDGVNVRELVEKNGPLSESDTVRFALHIAAALSHAAERDVVHRDIKPSNILVTRDGQAKLVDMGLARLHQVNEPLKEITQTGVTLGTFDYISPEQARDPRSADVRSDLYSLGCTLYFMLTGVPPFPEGTVLQKLLSHSSESPADLREYRPSMSGEIAAIVNKLMAKQPGQRYQAPHDLMADLVDASELLGLEGISYAHYAALPRASTWHSQFRRHLPWLVPIFLLLIACGVMRVFWSGSSSSAAGIPGRPELQPPSAAPADRSTSNETVNVPDTLNRGVVESAQSEVANPNRSAVEARFTSPLERDIGSPFGSSPLRERGGRLIVSPPVDATQSSAEWAPEGLPALAEKSSQESVTANESGIQETPVTTTIVVGTTADESSGPGELFVSTLELAVQRAREFPQVDTIELRFDERDIAPLTIDLRRALTFRAGDGYQPHLIFRPNGGLLRERRMFRLQGTHTLRFEGIHCTIQLPYESGPPCTLFDLHQINLISLADCTLTIRNEFGVPASFFSVQAPRLAAPFGGQEESARLRSPSIELERTIARGQAALVRAVEGWPFWLTWEQGLFASTERMVESGGLLDRSGAELIRIDLTNVTASMDRGLCRISIDDSGPYLPEVDVIARNCVLRHLLDHPLVEHLGVNSLEEAEAKFRYGGQGNYYESTEVRWRVVVVDEGEYRFPWTNRDGQWYEERFAERLVRWADVYRIRSAVPLQTVADYRLDAIARRTAGFDELQLPDLPGIDGG